MQKKIDERILQERDKVQLTMNQEMEKRRLQAEAEMNKIRQEEQKRTEENNKRNKNELMTLDKKWELREEETKRKMEEQMKKEKQQTELEMAQRIERERTAVEQKMERERIAVQQEMERQKQIAEAEFQRKMDEKQKEIIKITERRQYEQTYPIPDTSDCNLQSQRKKYPNSFFFQIIGTRGVGKSTLINTLLGENLAQTGEEETTLQTSFYDVTHLMKIKPRRYNRIFIVDQPGIGGLKITEACYYNRFGVGHFNYTFVLSDKGFNELDLKIVKHLIHHKRPLSIIRSQCDIALMSIYRRIQAKVFYTS